MFRYLLFFPSVIGGHIVVSDSLLYSLGVQKGTSDVDLMCQVVITATCTSESETLDAFKESSH